MSRPANEATLPFWDDFSITTADSPDSIRVWERDTSFQWNYQLSKDVFVNATLAINPPSYRVATFDGLDGNGAFHTDAKPWADQLVSDTIDLQGKTDVVLSFYWQAGGNVEIPEAGDSLILEFFNPLDTGNEWHQVWSIDGSEIINGEDTIFTQVAQEVTSEFLTQKFLFRFQSFGDKDGPFDAWHLDYIFLSDARGEDDFYYDDISLNTPQTSPFTPFNAVPVNQLLSNLNTYSGTVSVTASALEKPDQSQVGVPARYKIELRELISSTFIDSVDFGDQPTIPVNPDPLSLTSSLKVQTRDFDLSGLPSFDSLILENKVFIKDNIDSLFDTLNIDQFNDTIRTQILLHNYYAFDDGTAEFAAGTNISGGQVAVQYWLEEPDTLTHLDIYFPQIDPLSDTRPLTLNVFKRLDGGNPIRTQ
ncbi:MAG: hypothetical protein AAFY41_11150, partial [Bacteroidota bacterium]